MAEVEARVEAQGHDRGCRFGSTDAGDHAKNSRARVVTQVAVARWKGDHLLKRQAFDPVLKLARIIACVGTALEHRDDYNLDWNWLRRAPAQQTAEH